MEIKDLLLGKIGCECSKDHLCPIESVVIGENACDSLGSLIEKYQSILQALRKGGNGHICAAKEPVAGADNRADRRNLSLGGQKEIDHRGERRAEQRKQAHVKQNQ